MSKKDKIPDLLMDGVKEVEQLQIQEVHDRLRMQVTALKQQIQESLKTMQNTIDDVFKYPSSDYPDQTVQSEQPLAEETITSNIQQTLDAGRLAMENADKSAKEAMQSATESVQQTEKFITGVMQEWNKGPDHAG